MASLLSPHLKPLTCFQPPQPRVFRNAQQLFLQLGSVVSGGLSGLSQLDPHQPGAGGGQQLLLSHPAQCSPDTYLDITLYSLNIILSSTRILSIVKLHNYVLQSLQLVKFNPNIMMDVSLCPHSSDIRQTSN